jgi:hypothetical protein
MKVAEDRPYTHSEVQMIVARASLRNKAIVLLMSSAGLRVGAIPLLRIKDIEPVDKYNLYKINIYSRSKKSANIFHSVPQNVELQSISIWIGVNVLVRD